MSRNIANGGFCSFCNDKPVLQEESRPCTARDCGTYFYEYRGMMVANAECPSCGAEFLAWVDGSTRAQSPQPRDSSLPFFDLSFRSTFDDETGFSDLPKRRVTHRVVWELGEAFPLDATMDERRNCLQEVHQRIDPQSRKTEHRRQQRKTLRALDAARKALQLDSENPDRRKAYDDALSAYWACHNIRNSRRTGIQVT
jgi:hypothetical protein